MILALKDEIHSIPSDSNFQQMPPSEPTSKPTLVIPDTHQNISWVEAILNREANKVGQIVFLGDYFDPKVSAASTPEETARYFSNLKQAYTNPLTFLVGNHDLPYLYDLKHKRFPTPYSGNPYTNGAYRPEYSQEIQKHLSSKFIGSLQPFTLSEGYLLSHAGIHKSFFQQSQAHDLNALSKFQESLKRDLERLSNERSLPLAAVGRARRGLDEYGGVTWQDWFEEFEDHLPWPQIVGHTLLPEPASKSRSWNIDTKSGSYAILTNGEIEIRSEPK